MYNSDGSGEDPPLPSGTQPLHNQVAGHVFGTGKTKLGFLQLSNGTVVKPIHGCLSEEDQIVRRKSELSFYQKVFDKDCQDPILIALRPFMPTFHGTWQTDQHPGITYLQLEDVTCPFRRPCIMDVKMGQITYAPDAEPEKVAKELSKYPPAKDIGFQLVGTRVYQQNTRDYVVRDRLYLRKLTPQELYDKALSEFLGKDTNFNSNVAKGFLKRLKDLERWFLSQKTYQFICTSLLFVYEGDILSESDTADTVTDLRMIDFPRVYPAEGLDENYLCGLRSLIAYFGNISSN